MNGASYHAIYRILNDGEFLEASIRSIYPHITGATIITSYDRDNWNRAVEPDGTFVRLLTREFDPERKINLIVTAETNEPMLRNLAMANALPPRGARRAHTAAGAAFVARPDYFWIVDADEIWDDQNVARLKEYIRTHRAQAYLVHAWSYFRSWNWQIEERGWYVSVVRPGFWFGHIRQWRMGFRVRLGLKIASLRFLPQPLGYRILRANVVPPGVARFHHGSYIGDRGRIAAKLASSPHREDMISAWLERVWDGWGPGLRNFHPLDPERFPVATHVPTSDLPGVITGAPWPPGWLEH